MRFFHTLREKEYVIKRLKRGVLLPLIKYTLYRLHLSHLFFIHRPFYTMRVWYAPFAFWLWTHEDTEKSDEMFFKEFLKPGNIVIDCGAHLGTLTITASRLVTESGAVVACEMHPRTYSYLKQNIKDNECSNVTAINVAIGDTKEEVAITDMYVSDMNHVDSEEGTLKISMTTIDDIAQNLEHVDLIKLDIEGYELQALYGAEKTLPKTQAIYFEAAERSFARYGYTLNDVVTFLIARGFLLYAFSNDGQPFGIDSTYTPRIKFENILATRNAL